MIDTASSIFASCSIGIIAFAEADLQGFSTPLSTAMGLSAMAITHLCLRKLPKLPLRLVQGAVILTAINRAGNAISPLASDSPSEMGTQIMPSPNHDRLLSPSVTPVLLDNGKISLPENIEEIDDSINSKYLNVVKKKVTSCEIDSSLQLATSNGNEELVTSSIQNGADPNQRDKYGSSLLEVAILHNQLGIARLLIENGAVIDSDSLSTAILHDNIDAVALLLEYGADPNQRDEYRSSLLHTTFFRNQFGIARLLIENGAVIDFDSLSTAIFTGNEEIVTLSIQNGADLNQREEYGDSLLNVALHNQLGIARLLIENGAVIDSDSLSTAILHDNIDAATLLLEYGADPNQRDELGSSLLEVAIFQNQLGIARLLIENGADPNQRDKYGSSLLEVAILHNQLGARLLIENGAVIDFDSLSTAIRHDNIDAVALLLEYGADLNQRDKYGYSLLGVAILHNQLGIARLLIENGAVIDLDCLQRAIFTGNENVLAFLIHKSSEKTLKESAEHLIQFALQNKQIDIARLLMEKGIRIKEHDLPELLQLIFDVQDLKMAQWLLDDYLLDRVFLIETALEKGHPEFAASVAACYDGELLLRHAFEQKVGVVIRFLDKNNLADVTSFLKNVNDAKKIEALGYLFSLGIMIPSSILFQLKKNRDLEKGMKQSIKNILKAFENIDAENLEDNRGELYKIEVILADEYYREKFEASNPHAMSQLLIVKGLFNICDANFDEAYPYLEIAKDLTKGKHMESLLSKIKDFMDEQEKIALKQELCCPISRDIMLDPVKYVKNGHTHYFDRNSIVMHIRSQGNCPMTRQPLTEAELQKAPEKEKALAEYKESIMNSLNNLMREVHLS